MATAQAFCKLIAGLPSLTIRDVLSAGKELGIKDVDLLSIGDLTGATTSTPVPKHNGTPKKRTVATPKIAAKKMDALTSLRGLKKGAWFRAKDVRPKSMPTVRFTDLLRKLVKEGKLGKRGKAKGTEYVVKGRV